MVCVDEKRPVLTFDLDGVLCRPPFGINPGKGTGKQPGTKGKKGLLWYTEGWRYRGRKPMPGAMSRLRELSTVYDCKVVSARGEAARPLTEAWFRRYLGYCPELYLRPHWRETSAAFKARKVVQLGAAAHFEDDPHTAAWLSELIPRVFLVDWPRNRWLTRPNVQRIVTLSQALTPLFRDPDVAVRSEGDVARP
jgi:hypothetical protein